MERSTSYSRQSQGVRLTKSPAVMLITFLLAAIFALAIPFLAPDKADAKTKKSIITLPWDNPAQKPIPPTFILPRQNRWGCLACHANKSLSKFKEGVEAPLFVDPDVIGNSMHEQIACVDCHTNFTYEEHPAENPEDYRKVAGLACMKCHPFQAYLYKKSTHGDLALQNKLGKIDGKDVEPALCSSCHGFHDIQSPRFEPYKSKFRASGKKVCGQCHEGRYESYEDYYHGKAYKNKAKDAPVCWDCHGSHEIVKKDQAASKVSKANLPRTCGKCHDRPTSILTSYAPLIHNRQKALEGNFVYKILSIFIQRKDVSVEKKGQEADGLKEIVTGSPEEGLFSRIFDFFFPESLRPVGKN